MNLAWGAPGFFDFREKSGMIFFLTSGREVIRMRCPRCRRETTWEDNPWRPFCSERCKLIDLGQWVSEGYRIPSVEDQDQIDVDDLDVEGEPGTDERKN
jgi:endogenous inhibitor of DNA gyrase (YacG/DUF329 family)